MEKTFEIDGMIKKSLQAKAQHLELSDETWTKIISGLDADQGGYSRMVSYKRYAVVYLCAVLVILGTTLTFSGNARASAAGIIERVKTVFLLDKSNKVVERPANYAFLKPAYSRNTKLSDAKLSNKMGVKLAFPLTLDKTFKLQYRAEAIGFNKLIDYNTAQALANLTVQAIDNNTVFKDLKQYQPYRSVGGIYQDPDGVKVGTVIYNTDIALQIGNVNVTQTTDLKIGDQAAKWISLSYPIYPGNDLSQKPTGKATTHMLMWWKDGTTYQIWPLTDNSMSLAATVKLAQAFICAQK